MAMTSSFKQQCPSCEAMVPIRDPGLVGKKIDCPKCKYRFLVEEPLPEEDEEGGEPEPAVKEKNTAITNKKGKGQRLRDETTGPDEAEESGKAPDKKVLYIGIGLGVVALVVLVGGGILLFGGSSKPASTKTGPTTTPGKPAPTTQATTVADSKPAEPPPPAAEVIESGPIDDLTNLLPNETQALVSWGMDKLLNSSVKNPLLETSGSFNEATFQKTFGFPLENVKVLLTAVLPGAKPDESAFFSVMRLEKPFHRDHLTAALKLTPLPPVSGFESFTVNGDLDTLSALLLRLSTPSSEKISVHFLDDRDLLFADAGPMKKFLEEKRQPRRLTMEPPPPPDAPAGVVPGGRPPGIQPPPGPGAPPPPPVPGKRPPGARGVSWSPDGATFYGPVPFQNPAAPPAGPGKDERRPPEPQGPGAEPEPNASLSYMTVDPALKVAMDHYDREKVPAIFMVAVLNKPERVLPAEVTSPNALDQDALEKLLPSVPVPEGIQVMVTALHEFTEIKFSGMMLLHCDSDESARALKLEAESAVGLAASLLKVNWEMDVKTVSGPAGPPGAAGGPRGFPVRNATAAPPPPPGRGPAAADAGRDGSLSTSQQGRNVLVAVDLNISHKLYETIRDGLKAEMIQLKGQGELVANRPRVHELARALQAYVKAKGAYPRGALPRPPSSERGIDWYPTQRLSWMVELLPYLSEGDFKDLPVDPDKSWNEGSNFLTARVLIPQFLSPGDAKHARVRVPGRIGAFAATRFVGIAGIGLDAATYPAGDAANAKRLGVFGYDRVTKPDDIRDEAENTIALLQVPAGQITPWMAGGGSTVRGVSEGDDALRPFVSTEYKGKKGTFAVMADGKVRFIAGDMKPATFRALCTIAGEERINDINEIAPLVPEDAAPAESKPAPVAAATPDAKPPETPAAPAAAKAPLPAGWKETVNEEEGYAVALPPGRPINEPVPPLPGTTGGKQTGVGLDATGARYLVTCIRLPGPVPPAAQAGFFAGLPAAASKLFPGGKPAGETKTRLGDYPGVELVLQGGPTGKVIIKSYLVKDRSYTLAVHPVDKLDPKDVAAFFDSFRLLGK